MHHMHGLGLCIEYMNARLKAVKIKCLNLGLYKKVQEVDDL